MFGLKSLYKRALHRGQSMVEYALVLGLISLTCVALAQNMGVSLNSVFGKISSSCIDTAASMPDSGGSS